MLLLLGSCLALIIGPLVLTLAGARPRVVAALDGFVLVGVLGLVFLHVIPHAVVEAGVAAMVAACVGILLPFASDKLKSRHFKSKTVRPTMVMLALLALATHCLMDGAALINHGHHHGAGATLGFGVLLHRIPLGLTLWWMVSSTFGFRVATGVILGMMGATACGYFAADTWLVYLPEEGLVIFQALMAGSILHVAADAPPSPKYEGDGDGRSLNAAATAGAAVGAFVLWGIGRLHPFSVVLEGELHAADTFWTLAKQASPVLIVGFLGVGLLHGFVKIGWMNFLCKGGRFSQSLKGVVVGIPLPICSCGVLPFYHGLIRKGVPPAAAIGFLIVTPALGFDALLLSLPLLGVDLTVSRFVIAGVVAILSGWLLSRFFRASEPIIIEGDLLVVEAEREAVGARLIRSLKFGFGEYLDSILPWIVFGICIGTIAEPLMDLAAFDRIADTWEVPLAALVGIPVYVCASGATPLGVVLLHKGLSPGALIAFLMTGSAVHMSTFGVLRSMHSTRSAWALAIGVCVLAVLGGWSVNEVIGSSSEVELHAWSVAYSNWWEQAALVVMGLLFVGSLLRLGPRGFVAAILPGIPGSVLEPSPLAEDADLHEHTRHGGHDHFY